MAGQETPDEQSLSQLISTASQDLSTLIRDEIELAKTEMKKTAAAAGMGAGLLGAAGFFGYVAFLLLSVAAALGITAAGLHPAVGFAIVAGADLVVAAVCALIGLGRMKKARPPRKTIASMQEMKTLLRRPPSDQRQIEEHRAG